MKSKDKIQYWLQIVNSQQICFKRMLNIEYFLVGFVVIQEVTGNWRYVKFEKASCIGVTSSSLLNALFSLLNALTSWLATAPPPTFFYKQSRPICFVLIFFGVF